MTEKDISALTSAILAAAILGGGEKEKEEPKPNGDEIRKQAEDLGNRYYHAYLGFKDAGFNDEQAFQLVLKAVVGGK